MSRWRVRLEQLDSAPAPQDYLEADRSDRAGSYLTDLPDLSVSAWISAKTPSAAAADLSRHLNSRVGLLSDDVVWLPRLNRWVGATSPRLPKRLRRDSDAVVCATCDQVIVGGLGAVPVRTAGQSEQWLHEGDCYAEFAAWHQDTSVMDRERALELLERARRAGRLKSSNAEME